MAGLMSSGAFFDLEKMKLKASKTVQASWTSAQTATASASWTVEKSGYIFVILSMAGYYGFGTITSANVTVDGVGQNLLSPMYNIRLCIKKVVAGQKISISITGKSTNSTIDVGCFLYAT